MARYRFPAWHHAGPKFNFDETSIDIAKYETEAFFTEMLKHNLPMTDFMTPTSVFFHRFCDAQLRFPPQQAKGKKLSTAPSISSASRNRTRWSLRGLLGQSAILMQPTGWIRNRSSGRLGAQGILGDCLSHLRAYRRSLLIPREPRRRVNGRAPANSAAL